MSLRIDDARRKTPDCAHYCGARIAATLDHMNANDLHTAHRPDHPTAAPSTGGLHDLFVDSCRLGPAPTRAREGAVVVTTVLLIALVVVLVQPPVLLASILAGLAALHLAIRWVLGMRKWDRR